MRKSMTLEVPIQQLCSALKLNTTHKTPPHGYINRSISLRQIAHLKLIATELNSSIVYAFVLLISFYVHFLFALNAMTCIYYVTFFFATNKCVKFVNSTRPNKTTLNVKCSTQVKYIMLKSGLRLTNDDEETDNAFQRVVFSFYKTNHCN